MAHYVFETDLSVAGINRVIEQIEDYRDNILPKKIKAFVEALTELGATEVRTRIDESPLGGHVVVSTNISEEKTGCKAMIVAVGDVEESKGLAPFYTILAIEFGAGIYYNAAKNPNSAEFGLGPGTFPGQIHAFEDGWWFWNGDAQEWQYTHGVKATMPMYKAHQKMQKSIAKKAKEVFG